MTDLFTPLRINPLDVEAAAVPQSPARIFWRQLRKSPLAIGGGGLLACFYLCALLAPFIAPYASDELDRERYYHPPQPLHWIDTEGQFHLVPFIYATRITDPSSFRYEEDRSRRVPVKFFARGAGA